MPVYGEQMPTLTANEPQRPRRLQPGSRVAVVAPSSGLLDGSALDRGVQALEGMGLETFIDRVSGTGVGSWLYGSRALAMRGLDVVPGDLDFAVDDGWVVGEALTDLLVEPLTGMEGWVADSGGARSMAR